MKKNLILVIGISILFIGCTKVVEVGIKLPIYDRPTCKEMHKVDIGKTTIIGKDTNITMEDIRTANRAFIVIPKSMNALHFETIYLYRKKDIINYIKCDGAKDGTLDLYEAFNKDNNLKRGEHIKWI